MSHDFHQRPLLAYRYERYLEDQDIGSFLRSVTESYTIGSLERIVQIGDSTTRRGAVLALGRLASYSSNTVVGRALVDRDRGVRTLAENAIRHLWMRIGSPSQQRHLTAISEHLEEQQYDRAAQLATALLDDAPWIAQGWYFRGKAFFHLGQPEAATRDCHQALEVNSYHFLAASVMGQAFLQIEDHLAALDAFRRALRLNPNMEEVRAQVIHLQRLLKEK